MKPNSFIYKCISTIKKEDVEKYSGLSKSIILKLGNTYYLFVYNTKDFSNNEIKEVIDNGQLYLNTKLNKVSTDFLNDYKKLIKKGNYYEIDETNYFKKSEEEVIGILNEIFIGNCLDIGCGNSLYKDIFLQKKVNYLGIDIVDVDNGLNIINDSFENYIFENKFNTIFFFRSINHFENTNAVLEKALSLLENKGFLFIVENSAFGELKFPNQMFEGKRGDYEHFYNYSLNEFKSIVNKYNLNIIYESDIGVNTGNQWYICLQKK